MKINQNIFREYDIRGIAGDKFEPKLVEEYEKWYGPFPGITINLESTKAIGRAFGTLIKKNGGKKVVVGYEIRPFSDKLKAALIDGITDTGVDVIDAGITLTPFIYFLTAHLGYDGGVNITGSHNVYFYNGFKMVKKNAAPLYGQELQELYRLVSEDKYDIASQKGKVEILEKPYEIYKKFILSKIKLKRKINVIVDCGNGTPGLYAVDLLKSLGCNVIEGMFLEPDAYFPNHLPDPESPKNLRFLIDRVKEIGADVGIGFDADGDRAGFIDEKGTFISGDDIILLMAKDALSRNKGKRVLFDVKCTQLLETMIPQFGGIPYMHRTGHAPIKDTIQKNHDVILGGEVAGHFYFCEDHYRIDDAFWAAALVLRIFSEYEGTFSSMMSFIPKTIRTPEIKLPCEDSVKFDVVKRVVEQFSQKYKMINIDGARVMFDENSWGLVRASNTSPYLTIRFEAPTEERLIEIKNKIADVLDAFPEITDRLNRKEVTSLTGKLGYV